MLALAAYGLIGVFGHSLHGLLPCSDAACSSGEALPSADCSSCDVQAALGCSREPSGGPALQGAGHDADGCSLCLLLVQLKSGHATSFAADFSVERSIPWSMPRERCLAAAMLFARTARGPPAC